MAEPLLKVEGLVKNYGGLCAVGGVDLEVGRGKFVGLVGPNGCGKTTLLSSIYGLRPSDGGHVTFAGRHIEKMAPHQIFDLGMGNAFQFPRLFPTMTVLDNMIIAARNQPGDKLFNSLFRRGKWHRDDERLAIRAMELLQLLNISHLTFSKAGEMSGGQQKLLEIGRSLMAEPELLLLDEPAAGVNPVLGKQIFEELDKLKREKGMSFFIIEHRLELLMAYTDWVYVMDRGKIALQGEPKQVVNDPIFFDVYIGSRGGQT
ncbi:branched-chain amino acid transport protein LivG [Dehalogenimonas sp. WBC-2]|nr:branched-chain amino acid transport protein LivG [Dehalogenimonas sp. WBC-2]